MRKLTDKFEPEDVIALCVIMGCFASIIAGKDGIIFGILQMTIGYTLKTFISSKKK